MYVSSMTDMSRNLMTQPYSVTMSGVSNIPNVTYLIMSDPAQSHLIVTRSAATPFQLPLFPVVTLTSQSRQVMPLYSLVTEPSVSWTGLRPGLSTGARQTMRPVELTQVSGSTVSATASTLPGDVCSRGDYLNSSDRVNASMQGVCSNREALASTSPLNLGVFANQIPPLPKYI